MASSYCVPHQLNLLIGDLMKDKAFEEQIKLLVRVLVKIKYSADVRKRCDEVAAMKKAPFGAVVLPSATRWSYYVRVIDDFIEKRLVIQYLQEMDYFQKVFKMKDEESEEYKILESMQTDAYWNQLNVVSIILINQDTR